MFGLWCILLRKKHRRGWHSLRVGVVGIRFVWVSHGKRREFCRACLAKEVRRDSQLDVAREKIWNLACMFDKRTADFSATAVSLPPLLRTFFAEGWDLLAYQAHKIRCCTRNRSRSFSLLKPRTENKTFCRNCCNINKHNGFFSRNRSRFFGKWADEHTAQDFAVKELDIRIVWLSCGKKQQLGRTYLRKEIGKDLSAYKAKKSLYTNRLSIFSTDRMKIVAHRLWAPQHPPRGNNPHFSSSRCKESPYETDRYVTFAVYVCGGHTKRLAFCSFGCRTGIRGNFAAHI